MRIVLKIKTIINPVKSRVSELFKTSTIRGTSV